MQNKIQKWTIRYHKEMQEKGIQPNETALSTYVNTKGHPYQTEKDEYVKIKAYSNSKLSRIAKKLMGYLPEKNKPFKAFGIGHVIHQQLLEPHICNMEQYNLTPALARDTKGMIQALRRNTKIRYALNVAEKEKVIVWKDSQTKAKCKGKLDLISKRKITDIKTTATRTKEEFIKSCFKYGYDRQAAMYMDGAEKNTFEFIAVQKSKPYQVFTYAFKRNSPEIQEARKKYQFIITKALENKL